MQFQEILQELKINYKASGHEHCRPGWIQLDCPFCSKDWGHFRLGYNIQHHYCNCWSCGPKQVWEVLSESTGKSGGEIIKLLDELDRPKSVREERKRGGRVILPNNCDVLWGAHHKYLKERGLDPDEIIRLWKIEGIGLDPVYGWRILIPIFYKGELVSWTTRSISDIGQRYISASTKQERMNHKSLLYGEDYCRHAVIVCEGPIDVWSIGPGAVATFGTGFSPQQVAKIAKYPVRAICFDNEPMAQEQAAKLCSQLSCLPGETYNIKLTGKDANNTDQKEVQLLRQKFLGA